MQSPKSSLQVPMRVVIGLTLAVILDTAVQICWKSSVLTVPDNFGLLDTLWKTAGVPLFWLTMVLFISQFVNWMTVLEKADLSYAQPITALSYITVAILSSAFLRESITVSKIAGIALILLGVAFVAQTEHQTVSEGAIKT